jgi:Ca-activated chloride channel family protein
MKDTTRCKSSKRQFFILVTCLFLIHIIIINKITAQELKLKSIPYQDISSGSLYFKTDNSYFPALTQNSDYQVSVNGLLARVNVTQAFKNSSNLYLEAVYVFPLIDDAAVDSMIMEIGERRIIGKIKEKHQAQQLYEKAKQQGKKVSLVSEQRPNLFTTKLANIAPGETIKISLSYLQSITLKDETFSLRIPLTLTPRFIPSTLKTHSNKNEKPTFKNRVETIKVNAHGWAVNNASVTDAREITPFQISAETLNKHDNENRQQTVNLAVNVNTVLPLTDVISRYHRISKTQLNDQLSITLADNNTSLNQDFVLQWQLAQGDVPKAAFFQQSDFPHSGNINAQNGYHHGLLMLMPPKQAYVQTINKEVIYIIDTSGSMGGVAIRQAKQSLSSALDLLNSHDSFNIIAFDDEPLSLFSLSMPASIDKIELAKHWLANLDAGGGTNMYPAIEQALQSPKNENTYRQVIFVTDGSVGNEGELFNLIARKLGNTRLHTIGIGSAPNGYFMSQAAKIGRGTYRYIGSINEVKEQMTTLFSQIGKPLMQDIKITWPVAQVEMFPEKISDLYSGQPLLISVRWPKNSDKNIKQIVKVSGKLATKIWQEQVNITNNSKKTVSQALSSKNVDNGVAQWWAKQKINHLTFLQRRSSKQKKVELKSQITQLALKHHLISPYTSFIATEEKLSRKHNKPLHSIGIKNLMPKGSTQIVPLANTALGLVSYFYLGLLLIIAAFFIQLLTRKDLQKSC